MSKGAILLIEDDEDDTYFFKEIVEDIGLKNKVIAFNNANNAFEFLDQTTEDIFIIFSDINMPRRNGLQFKHDIDANPTLRRKSIPFIFYSTTANKGDVTEAFETLTVQGFFRKGTDYEKTKQQISMIMQYWEDCEHPNKF
jgi:CheY-like chemotaxis protein